MERFSPKPESVAQNKTTPELQSRGIFQKVFTPLPEPMKPPSLKHSISEVYAKYPVGTLMDPKKAVELKAEVNYYLGDQYKYNPTIESTLDHPPYYQTELKTEQRADNFALGQLGLSLGRIASMVPWK